MGQQAIPAVVMRGGTSRGIFFHAEDLPADTGRWDALFCEVMGSPDRLQVDGLGGTHSNTSKVMVVRPSAVSGCDVEYRFAQVAVGAATVHYQSNCGSLAAAVAAYAVDEGLVEVTRPETELTLLDLNTGVRIRARLGVDENGRARVAGELTLPGLPGSGAPITTTYLDPGGAITGKQLPTGATRDRLDVPGVGSLDVSVVDASSALAFVRAEDLGVPPDADPVAVNADPRLLARAEALRAACAVRLGMAASTEEATRTSAQQPKIAICAPPATGDDASLRVRTFSMGRMHAAFPVTGLVCAAAATALPGTIPNALRGDEGPVVRLRHAGGVIPVEVGLSADPVTPRVETVAIVQTARRILQGEVLTNALG